MPTNRLSEHEQAYPIDGAEVDRLGEVEPLVEAAVIGSREGDDELSGTLVGPVNLKTYERAILVVTVH